MSTLREAMRLPTLSNTTTGSGSGSSSDGGYGGTAGTAAGTADAGGRVVFVDIAGAVQSLIFGGQTTGKEEQDGGEDIQSKGSREDIQGKGGSEKASASFMKVLRDWYAIGSADVAFVSRWSTFGETAWCSMADGSESTGSSSTIASAARKRAYLIESDSCQVKTCSLTKREGSRGSTIVQVPRKELEAAVGA
jgi:hypothetical protein